MPNSAAVDRAFVKSRDAMAATSTCRQCCSAGRTFLCAKFDVPNTPQRSLLMVAIIYLAHHYGAQQFAANRPVWNNCRANDNDGAKRCSELAIGDGVFVKVCDTIAGASFPRGAKRYGGHRPAWNGCGSDAAIL